MTVEALERIAEYAKPPSPTMRLHEVTMAALTRPPREPDCNVDLTLNAKGDVQILVSAHGADVTKVGLAVEAEFDRLRAKYPRSEPAVTAKELAKRKSAEVARAKLQGVVPA